MIECFDPVFSSCCTVLILGSCPSVRSLQAGQYYAHPQNRFWRVMAAILNENLPNDYQEKQQMLLRHGVGLWDVIASCTREGSSDNAIRNEKHNDVAALVKGSQVKCIALNGGKAKAAFVPFGTDVVFLPSTSPANARMGLKTLTEVWQNALKKYIK